MSRSARAAPLLGGAILAALCNAAGARADDASQGVMLPALQEEGGSIIPGAATLNLGDAHGNRAVVLKLHLTGSGTALSIHIPPFGWLGEAEPYPDRQFPELRATLDGKPAHILSQPHVMFGGADITASVAAAQLDPFTITATPPLVDPAQGGAAGAAFAALQKQGAVTTDQDGNMLAQWTAGRNITIPLGAVGGQSLGLTYMARPAFALVQGLGELGAKFPLGDYCVTPDVLRRGLGNISAPAGLAVEGFAIPTGIGARPPEELRVTLAPWVASAESGFPTSVHLLRVFCGVDQKPVVTGLAGIGRDAAPGQDGVVRVLVIAPVPPAS